MIQRFTPILLAAAATITASTNSPGVDVSRFTGQVKILLNSSVTGAAGQTADYKLQHSDDGTTWTDVPQFDAFAQVTSAAGGLQERHYNADRFKKLVRVVSTLAGSTPTVTRSVTMLGKLAY